MSLSYRRTKAMALGKPFINVHEDISANKRRTWLILFLFFMLIGVIGIIIGFLWGSASFGLSLAVFFGIVYTIIVFASGDSMILSMTHARPVTQKEFPFLFHTVEGLSLAAGIPTPKAYVIDDTALNAFATGRKPETASIVVTTGLLQKLNRQELEGVIAHEMSHIKNNDIKVMMLAAVLVGVVILLSDILLRSFLWGGGKRDREGNINWVLILIGVALAILAPLIAELIKLAVSRRREYLADANGALLTRYPAGLASALRKISADPDPLVDTANRATAHLFISTPFAHRKTFFTNLFSTHPPIEERIKRLESM